MSLWKHFASQQSFPHFASLYTQNKYVEPTILQSMLEHILNLLIREENLGLMKLILETKILQTIWSIEPDKVLGLDGFFLDKAPKIFLNSKLYEE